MRIEISPNREETTIYFYGRIGGVTNAITDIDFINAVKLVNTNILNIRINSPGGDVFQGYAMYQALQSFNGVVNTYIDGVCASMATVIALAGAKVYMAKNALFMIHNPQLETRGDARKLIKEAELLDKVKETLMNVYSGRTGLAIDELSTMLDNETWLNAQEALAMKFIDQITGEVLLKDENQNVTNSTSNEVYNLYKFKNDANMNLDELISKLKLQKGADMPTILEAIDKLQKENDELKQVKQKKDAKDKKQIDNILTDAVRAKKITANLMPQFRNLLEKDFDGTVEALDGMQGVSKVSDLLDRGTGTGGDFDPVKTPKSSWTLDDYRKHAPNDLRRNPTLYKQLLEKAGIKDE